MKWIMHIVLVVPVVAAMVRSEIGAADTPAGSMPTSQVTTQAAARDPHGPIHRIVFPPGQGVGCMAFSPDGEKLYVQVNRKSINLWEVLVYYWPEVLGGVFALAAIVLLFVLFRIRAKPRLVGLPHCRKCNYCLKDCASERCPECGRPTRRPVIGRPMWLRTLPCTVPLALIVVCYGGLWAVRASRTNFVSNYYHWWWDWLAEWAESDPKRAWLKARVQWVNCIDAYSPFGGKKLKAGPTFVFLGRLQSMAVSPDGKRILLAFADSFLSIDAESGRIVDKLQAHVSSKAPSYPWRGIAGFSDDGRKAYAVELSQELRKTFVVEWELETGRSKTLIESPASTEGFKWQEFRVVPHSEPLSFIEYPEGFVSFNDPVPGEIRIRRASTPTESSLVIQSPKRSYVTPITSPDGSIAYCVTALHEKCITGYDITTGEAIERIWMPAFRLPRRLACDPSGRALIVEVLEAVDPSALDPNSPYQYQLRNSYHVWSLNQHRWLARFNVLRYDWYREDTKSVTNNRFIATSVGLILRGGSGSAQMELWIFDMSASAFADPGYPDPSIGREVAAEGWKQITPFYHVREDHPLARRAISLPEFSHIPSAEYLLRHAE